MIRGILIVLALGALGGWVGYEIADWWVATKMPSATFEAIMPLGAGLVLGTLAGLGTGIGIAYALGRRERG